MATKNTAKVYSKASAAWKARESKPYYSYLSAVDKNRIYSDDTLSQRIHKLQEETGKKLQKDAPIKVHNKDGWAELRELEKLNGEWVKFLQRIVYVYDGQDEGNWPENAADLPNDRLASQCIISVVTSKEVLKSVLNVDSVSGNNFYFVFKGAVVDVLPWNADKTSDDFCQWLNTVTSNFALLVILGSPDDSVECEVFKEDVAKGVQEFVRYNKQNESLPVDGAVDLYAQGVSSPNSTVHFYQCHSDLIYVKVLLDPEVELLKNELNSFLSKRNFKYRQILYSGHGNEEGNWVLKDGSFTADQFAQTAVQAGSDGHRIHATVSLNTYFSRQWNTESISNGKLDSMYLRVYSLPDDQEPMGLLPPLLRPFKFTVDQLIAEVDNLSNKDQDPFHILPEPLYESTDELPPHPCSQDSPALFVFPGETGDCAIFSVAGFKILVDGGFKRQLPCWKFIQPLPKVDALFISHIDEDHTSGIKSLLRRKVKEASLGKTKELDNDIKKCLQFSPNIPKIYFNGIASDRRPLNYSRSWRDANQICECLEELENTCVDECYASDDLDDNVIISKKFPSGKLQVYILSPSRREVKRILYHFWETSESTKTLPTGIDDAVSITVPNATAICVLVEWVPSDETSPTVRVLFPSDAPKSSILGGLERQFGSDEIEIDVMYVPNHGNKNSSDSEFYEKVGASLYVVSGKKTGKQAPHKEVLESIVASVSSAGRTASVLPTYPLTGDLADLEGSEHIDVQQAVNESKDGVYGVFGKVLFSNTGEGTKCDVSFSD